MLKDGHQLLRRRSDGAIITVEPGGVAGVVDVGDIVALGGLAPVVVDHAKQLVLPLLGGVLALAGHREQLPGQL